MKIFPHAFLKIKVNRSKRIFSRLFPPYYAAWIKSFLSLNEFFLKIGLHRSYEKKTFPISEGIAMSAPSLLHSDHFWPWDFFKHSYRWCDFLHILLCGHIWNVQWRKGNTCKVFSFSCVSAWVMMTVTRWWLVMIVIAEMRQVLGAPPMICGAGLPADVGPY